MQMLVILKGVVVLRKRVLVNQHAVSATFSCYPLGVFSQESLYGQAIYTHVVTCATCIPTYTPFRPPMAGGCQRPATGEWDVRLKFEFGLSTQHYANVQKHGIVDALHAKRWAGANHPAETLQSPMPAVHAMKLT